MSLVRKTYGKAYHLIWPLESVSKTRLEGLEKRLKQFPSKFQG
jgi:hypothetical protein